jgi:hypothetical protein
MSSNGGGAPEIKLPGLHTLEEWIGGANSSAGFFIPGWFFVALYFVSIGFYNASFPLQSTLNFAMVLLLGTIWMPIVFGRFALMRFIHMRRMTYISEQKTIVLEMRIPREVRKSPIAMESVFANLHIGPGESSWFSRYIKGGVRPWHSFELVSRGGEITFYIYTREFFRRAIETYFYSQYPEVEIIEAIDYSRLRNPSDPAYKMYACEYEHTNKAPYPIKTYVEFGLDKPGLKPEEQIDPFSQIVELFGALKEGEELWMQIVIRTAKSERYRGKKKGKDKFKFKDEVKELVEELKKKRINETGFSVATEMEKREIEAIERNATKLQFDVGIRAIYSAPSDHTSSLNPFVALMWKPFSSELLNGIVPAGHFGSEKFSGYPWEDLGGVRHKAEMREAVEVYRLRSFFHPPFRSKWMTMSTEELATIFHIPSSTVKTPNLPRIQSTTTSAPANLPQ